MMLHESKVLDREPALCEMNEEQLVEQLCSSLSSLNVTCVQFQVCVSRLFDHGLHTPAQSREATVEGRFVCSRAYLSFRTKPLWNDQ